MNDLAQVTGSLAERAWAILPRHEPYARGVTEPRKIIIDTDPGVDDAMAIFYALSSPELDVVGLTTIFGNATTVTATYNALALLELAGRPDVPVARGADTPLVAAYGGPVDFVHGADGQGNAGIATPTTSAVAAARASGAARPSPAKEWRRPRRPGPDARRYGSSPAPTRDVSSSWS